MMLEAICDPPRRLAADRVPYHDACDRLGDLESEERAR
jgi:hypothetical protein